MRKLDVLPLFHSTTFSAPVTRFLQELLEVVPPPKVDDEEEETESISENSMRKESVQF